MMKACSVQNCILKDSNKNRCCLFHSSIYLKKKPESNILYILYFHYERFTCRQHALFLTHSTVKRTSRVCLLGMRFSCVGFGHLSATELNCYSVLRKDLIQKHRSLTENKVRISLNMYTQSPQLSSCPILFPFLHAVYLFRLFVLNLFMHCLTHRHLIHLNNQIIN